MPKNERNDFMTNAKDEYFKFNPIYEAKLQTGCWSLDIIGETFTKAYIELSVVENEGRQGLVRTTVRVDQYERSHWWEEGVYPCVYESIKLLDCVSGVGLIRLKKGDEKRIVVVRAGYYPDGNEALFFEVDFVD